VKVEKRREGVLKLGERVGFRRKYKKVAVSAVKNCSEGGLAEGVFSGLAVHNFRIEQMKMDKG
jgi:hypothetical protein